MRILNWPLIGFLACYQWYCGCVSPQSCCRKGLTAAHTLPLHQAIRACWVAYGECRESG